MSGSSGGGGGNSEFKPPNYVVPYSKEMLGRASDLSQSPFQSYGGQRFAGFTPFQQQGFNMVQGQAGAGGALTGLGAQSLADTVSGQYLNGNPYLDSLIGTAQGDIVDQYRYGTAPMNMAMASRSGSFDNSGIAGKDMMDRFSLARALGDVENQIRFGNYQGERQNQLGATGQALGFGNQTLGNLMQAGGQQQQLGQAQADFDFGEFMRQIGDPFQKLGTLQQSVQTGQGGYGTTNTSSSVPNWAIGSTIGGSLLGK